MKKTNNTYAAAVIPTARRICVTCEPKKPKRAFAHKDEPVKKTGKKRRPYPARINRDPYNCQSKRHKTSHGYRLAARDVARLLADDAINTELDTLRKENRDLKKIILAFLLPSGEDFHSAFLEGYTTFWNKYAAYLENEGGLEEFINHLRATTPQGN